MFGCLGVFGGIPQETGRDGQGEDRMALGRGICLPWIQARGWEQRDLYPSGQPSSDTPCDLLSTSSTSQALAFRFQSLKGTHCLGICPVLFAPV